jgi:uncharacterized SAM-dependent methyltransferase
MALDGLPQIDGDARRLGFFPGSTIGNLEPAMPPLSCAGRDACLATTEL